MTTTTSKTPVLRAAIDSRSLPIELFGSSRSRHQRKLVYNYLATYANPDGTSAYPSLTTIAKHCGLSRRGLIRIVQWLEGHFLLEKQGDRSPKNTNNYTILFSSESQARCRAAILRDEEEQRLSGRADKTRRGRSRGGKNAAAKRRANGECTESLPASSDGDCSSHYALVTHHSHPASDSRAQMATQEHVAGDCAESHDRPSLPSLESPIPSNQPSQLEGWADGALASENPPLRTTKDLAESFARWMSDLLAARTDRRPVRGAADVRRIEAVLLELDPSLLAVAFYRFCNRPMGVHTLTDPFGMFWREFEQHRQDAQDKLEHDGSVLDIIDELHGEVFEWEQAARERSKTVPSMRVYSNIRTILGLESEAAQARA